MIHTAEKQPAVFFATAARILPREVGLTIQQSFAGLEANDYAILRAIKDGIPKVGELTLTETFEFVLQAIQAATAKTIEPSDPAIAGQEPAKPENE